MNKLYYLIGFHCVNIILQNNQQNCIWIFRPFLGYNVGWGCLKPIFGTTAAVKNSFFSTKTFLVNKQGKHGYKKCDPIVYRRKNYNSENKINKKIK